MGEGIFSKLATTKKFTYDDINGIAPISFTYKLLSVQDQIDAQNYEPKEDAVLYLIYISIKDNIDEEMLIDKNGNKKELTIDDIRGIPACLVEAMFTDILEFNNIDVEKIKESVEQ
jgi:hypothetical protein